jgi:DNA repair exonuclease SbcCD ATPase subunit
MLRKHTQSKRGVEMGNEADRDKVFQEALQGKTIPILTLDNKWYQMFVSVIEKRAVVGLEQELNELLKRQGKVHTESKSIRKLKKKLMEEIVPLVDELEQKGTRQLEDKIKENKRLIEECNEKLTDYKLELTEIPSKIEEANRKLMLATMQYAYQQMKDNTEEIMKIAQWVAQIRIELKENLVQKQQMEIVNRNIYSYMHNLFGAEVIDLFDMKYNPEEQAPKVKPTQETKATTQDNPPTVAPEAAPISSSSGA